MTNLSTVILSDRFADAFAYALQLHRHQLRKVRPIAYISHPMAVASLVLEDGGSEDEAIAALLHDAVEDQGGEPIRLEILHRYGSNVAAIVEDCTIPPRSASQTWQHHKLTYLDQIQRSSPAAQRVILADKLHNVRSLITNLRQVGESTWSAFAASKADNIWLHQALADLFESHLQGSMVVEFRQQVNILLSLT
ncbi:MAG: bifunctional (p)ppGpp synthetase/guanosine-3',5'-bis(diphosphate) 3'-pyrophosphohydrolase [Leptolyngbyaceae cyanobacterium SM1_4_3]|nr:bifunctional (p)ppGpp synthetase/guanosine-3',5'-bis(diphosphate) 3'-pyrophosphohydrolase [Leptolyngbyaceae cyanobacterium SM1_4_3]